MIQLVDGERGSARVVSGLLRLLVPLFEVPEVVIEEFFEPVLTLSFLGELEPRERVADEVLDAPLRGGEQVGVAESAVVGGLVRQPAPRREKSTGRTNKRAARPATRDVPVIDIAALSQVSPLWSNIARREHRRFGCPLAMSVRALAHWSPLGPGAVRRWVRKTSGSQSHAARWSSSTRQVES